MILNRRARRALKSKGVSVNGRDSVAIQKEYVELCVKLGEVYFRSESCRDILSGLNSDKDKLTQAIKKLQKEYEAHTKSEQAKKLEEAKKAGDNLNAQPNPSPEASAVPPTQSDAPGTPAV
jgi:hypothetical protein